MKLKSHNMNYIFNVEYFENIFCGNDVENILKERNTEIYKFKFDINNSPLEACKTEEVYGDAKAKYQDIVLYTLYPGLLVGTGNPHDIAVNGALKCGFTFDYVTGAPYITGSTLKGMLRSYFPGDKKDKKVDSEYEAMIRGILGKEKLDVFALKQNMFENNDVFLGAYPVTDENDKTLLEMEYITPHKEKFKNPSPISMVKVKSGVKFIFSFIFSDYIVGNEVIVSAEEKTRLCKELLTLMGIGAKTNVGFGRFADKKPEKHIIVTRQEFSKDNDDVRYPSKHDNANYRKGKQKVEAPLCENCKKNFVTYNEKKMKYNSYCRDCFKKKVGLP